MRRNNDSIFKPINFPTDNKISQISSGNQYSIAIDNCGDCYSWGSAKNGALGLGNSKPQPEPRRIEHFAKEGIKIMGVSCGANHSAFIDHNKNLYTCGANYAGQLGIGNRKTQYFPSLVNVQEVEKVRCGTFHTLFLTSILHKIIHRK